jgi:hypothetical protein
MNSKNLFAIAALAALHVVGVHARTFHVAPNGDDANSGESNAPLRTPQRAAELARAGDTVLVHAGVYQGGAVRQPLTPAKPIRP